MEGFRVVDRRGDAGRLQFRHEGGSLGVVAGEDRVLRPGAFDSLQESPVSRRHRRGVRCSRRATSWRRSISSGKICELGEQDRGLEGVQAAVDPDPDVLVLVAPLAVDPDGAEDLVDVVVVREAHPPVAVTAEGLGGEEGGAGDVAEGAGLSSFVLAAEGLGGVLDDREAVTGGDGVDRVVVRGQAEEVDGDDGAGAEGFPAVSARSSVLRSMMRRSGKAA